MRCVNVKFYLLQSLLDYVNFVHFSTMSLASASKLEVRAFNCIHDIGVLLLKNLQAQKG